MGIEFQNVIQKYGDLIAVNNFNLHINDGEMIALIGPSGCGKTTLLRTIAGLLPLHSGNILIDDKEISHLPPQDRNSVIVFQNYALFPHMTVEENISYGLKVRKYKKSQIKEKVDKILSKVELAGLNKRKINELSGGQQQRVALARALIVEPSILLFDEPLSNLDQKLRISMRHNIRKIQQEYGITSIYVTHDQEEAMSISDRIVVMKNGKIEQVGTPTEIYFQPKNKFIAEFMGTANILKFNNIVQDEDYWLGEILNKPYRLSKEIYPNIKSKSVEIMFRPEDMEIDDEGYFEGTVSWQEVLGSIKRINIKCNDNNLELEQRKYHRTPLLLNTGDAVRFNITSSEGHIMEEMS